MASVAPKQVMREFTSGRELMAHYREVRARLTAGPPPPEPEAPVPEPDPPPPAPPQQPEAPLLTVPAAEPAPDHPRQTPPPPRPTVKMIIHAVAAEFRWPQSWLRSRRRTVPCVTMRQVVALLACEFTEQSTVWIGKYALGGRDHSTVCHATKSILMKMERDPVLAHKVVRLRRLLSVEGPQ
jgi:Bacterial dnaA protein helix-turn-helix